MLPLRVELEGFLTYRNKTVFDFRRDWLWAITGANGTGKSAIFDGITYVLYGHHRGGEKHDEKLMSQGCDFTRVAFDFAVGQQTYRVERTIMRRRGRTKDNLRRTRGAYYIDLDGPERAVLIPGTDVADGLKGWVSDTVGMGLKAFTSSVLLEQGEADRFVVAEAAERKEILMEILDLASYKELESVAKEHRDEYDHDVRRIDGELGPLKGTTEEVLRAAEEHRDNLLRHLDKANELVKQATTTRGNSESYQQIKGNLSNTLEKLRKADEVLEKADEIESEWLALRRLREALPSVEEIVRRRAQAVEARAEAVELRRQAHEIDLDALRSDCEAKTALAASCRDAYEAARKNAGEARRAVNELSKLANAGRELSGLEESFAQSEEFLVQLKVMLADRQKKEQFRTSCSDAAQALPWLRALSEHRDSLKEADDQLKSAQDELSVQQALVQKVIGRVRDIREKERGASARTATLRDELKEIEADLRSASKTLDQRREAAGEGTCSRCGQAVEPEQIQNEIDSAEGRVAQLAAAARDLSEKVSLVESEMTSLASEADGLEERLSEIQATIREMENQILSREQQRDFATVQITQAIRSLPHSYNTLSFDESYPIMELITDTETLVASFPQAEDECRKLERLDARATLLAEANENRRARIAELKTEYPIDRMIDASAHYDELVATADGLEKIENSSWEALQTAEESALRASEQLESATESRQRLTNDAVARDGTARVADEVISTQAARLGDGWQETVVSIDVVSLDVLRQRATDPSGIEGRKRELESARQDHTTLISVFEMLEQQVERIPEPDRIPLNVAELQLTEAQNIREQRQTLVNQAVVAVGDIDQRLKRRLKLEDERKQAGTSYQDYKLLSQLLSKEGLQAWLVQAAQGNIGHSANEFLSSMSNGLLQVRMQPEGDDLEIKVTDLSSGQDPMDVKFVSGSQRFRTAVAVALAIGQYSGGGSRWIRSVIIDEGFGGLDISGRRDMIDQLKGLYKVLDRVILVSHQEEFLDAFPNGYHIEKNDGTSKVSLRGSAPELASVV